MEDVSVRELRDYGGQILDRVERGETAPDSSRQVTHAL
jgi:antitoxin (DNA-binding transcriptional repressor) of toxin-antitoxin stability system